MSKELFVGMPCLPICKEFWNFLGEDEDVRRTVFPNKVQGKREQSTATIGMTSQKFEL